VDTDVVIQTAEARPLQSIVDEDGYMALRRIEESILLSLDLRNHVIATGGSAVYSGAAMGHLKGQAVVVFLDVAFETLAGRVRDFGTRGLAKRPEQTFRDLYDERRALYERHADVTVRCGGLDQEELAALLVAKLAETAAGTSGTGRAATQRKGGRR
jgi:shikimate kinase